MALKLNIYDIIQGPVISDKAYKLNKKSQLVLQVHPDANKRMIKQAIENLFNVKVKKIGTLIRDGKSRMMRGKRVTGKKIKRAIVTLQEGYSLDLFNQANASVAQSEK